jgi:hypothetical protein
MPINYVVLPLSIFAHRAYIETHQVCFSATVLQADVRDVGVQAFLRQKTFLLTGTTGFLGKVVLEQLLRVQPEVQHVYLLIQARKDQTANERFLQVRSYVRIKKINLYAIGRTPSACFC